MLRFLPLVVLFFTLIQPEPAKAQCLIINMSGDIGKEYKHFRDHKKGKRHGPNGKKRRCGGRHGGDHHRSHHHLKPCMVCRIPGEALADIVKNYLPEPALVDEGFCSIPKSEFRSEKFLIGDQNHLLSILIVNNELVVELIWLNNERNVTDDGKYIAFPEGFATPAEPTQIPITQFPDKAQFDSKSFACNNTRSLVWDSHSGQVIPSFFGGRINMVYTKDVIYTETSLTTDLSSTAFMSIKLKRVPNKKTTRAQ